MQDGGLETISSAEVSLDWAHIRPIEHPKVGSSLQRLGMQVLREVGRTLIL